MIWLRRGISIVLAIDFIAFVVPNMADVIASVDFTVLNVHQLQKSKDFYGNKPQASARRLGAESALYKTLSHAAGCERYPLP